jgi:hypothetical protein
MLNIGLHLEVQFMIMRKRVSLDRCYKYINDSNFTGTIKDERPERKV